MKEIISKELLSVVFLEEIYTDIEIQNAEYDGEEVEWKEVYFNHKRFPLDFVTNKCKEWAMNHHYSIRSEIYRNGSGYVFCEPRTSCLKTNSFTSNNEPEAIFKACQWIIDNKDKS